LFVVKGVKWIVNSFLIPIPLACNLLFILSDNTGGNSMEQFKAVRHEAFFTTQGEPEAVQPYEKVILDTALGPLIPVYSVEDMGRKKLSPVRFDRSGSIKSISLQQATEISTSIGSFNAELVTFYESGALCRLFPLNGKLSGFWSEKNEYELAETLYIPTPAGVIKGKPIYLHFYETGELKSVTFWPKERIVISTPIGELKIRRGISFHQNGALASCEPASPLLVETPIGNMIAFDPDPNGMNGERNSLTFSEEGTLTGLATTEVTVRVSDEAGNERFYEPVSVPSMCSDTVMIKKPLFIEFRKDLLLFRHESKDIGWAALTDGIELQACEPAPLSVNKCGL
jgi:hypothetical protein